MAKATTPPKKLQRAAIVEIYEALGEIKGALDSVMHRWTAAAMRRNVADIAVPIIEARTDTEKLRPTEYVEARENLVRGFAMNDSAGRPLVAQGQYVLDPERKSEFETAAIALREQHKDIISKFEDEVKRVNEFLRDEVEFTFPELTLKLSWFNKTVKQEHIEVLFDMIEQDFEAAAAEKPEKKSSKKG